MTEPNNARSQTVKPVAFACTTSLRIRVTVMEVHFRTRGRNKYYRTKLCGGSKSQTHKKPKYIHIIPRQTKFFEAYIPTCTTLLQSCSSKRTLRCQNQKPRKNSTNKSCFVVMTESLPFHISPPRRMELAPNRWDQHLSCSKSLDPCPPKRPERLAKGNF